MSVGLRPANAEAFAALLAGRAPPGTTALAKTEIASPAVLEMLAGLSASIDGVFAPNAWMIVDDKVVCGLISLVRQPADHKVMIGYGIAESERGRGLASEAVRQLIELFRADPAVQEVIAETATTNLASQHVLRVNAFEQTGIRTDEADGELICWRIPVAP